MVFKPIKTRKIYEEIIEQIRTLMTNGTLKPGDKMLSERELAEQLQVSRASVREALRVIEIMGLIEIRSGEGTFVRETCVDSIIQPLGMFMAMEQNSFFDVFEVRKILDSYCAYLAANRATDEEIDKLRSALEEMEHDIHSSKLGAEADTKFHVILAEATHNSFLLRLVNTIIDSISNSVKTARQHLFANPDNADLLYLQHKRIFNKIVDKDSEGAYFAMMEHLRFAQEEMAKNLANEDEK